MPGCHVHSVYNIAIIYFTCGMWACLLPQAWGRRIPGDPAFSKRFQPPCCSGDTLDKGHGLQGVGQWVPRWLPPWARLRAPPQPRSLSMALPGPEAQSLSHGDELRLTLPLSCLRERSDCLRSQLLQLWCRCRLNFLERLQDLPSGFRHWVCLRTPGLRGDPATVQCLTVYKHVLISSGSLEAQLQS